PGWGCYSLSIQRVTTGFKPLLSIKTHKKGPKRAFFVDALDHVSVRKTPSTSRSYLARITNRHKYCRNPGSRRYLPRCRSHCPLHARCGSRRDSADDRLVG